MSLGSKLSRLTNVSPPVLTAYLDVNPGNERNQSAPPGYVRWLKSAGQALRKELPRPEQKTFQAQLKRIDKYLRTTRSRSRSLVVFAGPQLWEVIPLQVDVGEELHWGKPSLQHLAWILDEHRLRGAVLIGGSGARFFRFWLGTVAEDPAFDFALDISSWRKPHLVGPSTPGVSKRTGVQRDLVGSRAAKQRLHFLGQLARRIVDWSDEGQISPIVLVGDAEEIETVLKTVPAAWRHQMIAHPKLLSRISPSEAGKQLLPALNRWERDYERRLVEELMSGEGSHQAVTGLDQTLDKLQRGQVRELVVARGIAGSVQQCTNCGWVDRSADPRCAICGSERQPRTLRTILPELASSLAVPIEVVAGEAAKKLRTTDGIGAWLRTARARPDQKANVPLLSQTG